jgi:DinB superfamily
LPSRAPVVNVAIVAPCDECGFDYESLDRDQVLRAVVSMADEHRVVLVTFPRERLRDHLRPASWSPLEYGCHVRDVLRVQSERVALAQTGQTPRFAPMRRDERAVEERYNDQDPRVVADEIVAGARLFTETLGALDDDGWLRTGIYPFPAPEERTVDWIGRWTAHELAHHLFDNRRLLGSAAG